MMVCIASAAAAAASQPWQRLEGCTYVAHPFNDGDSFHVLHEGREYIFRLYFVDTPEGDEGFNERVREQAAYFGVEPTRAVAAGHQADEMARTFLAQPFTVVTRWQGAMGRSKLPRFYAFIEAGGKDLAFELVGAGLARVYGVRATAPDGRKAEDLRAGLLAREDEARFNRRGTWAFARSLDVESARRLAATTELKTVVAPRIVAAYSTEVPRRRIDDIARDTPVQLVEEFTDGWVDVLYTTAEGAAQRAYCLRWDLSLPELPLTDPAHRASVQP